MMALRDDQILRYSRHILLPQVGGVGQERLLAASVLVVGAGGLGSAVLQYLAAAGIGRIVVIDDDTVDLSNLQRQVIHDQAWIGRPKVDSAATRIAALNPDVAVEAVHGRLTDDNASTLIQGVDVVVDGSDNFDTRYRLNDVCFRVGRPLVSAAMLRFEGQLSTFKPYLGDGHPCYRCAFPEPPPSGMIPSCSQAGVIGALPGWLGSLQALEVIKEILGIGESLSGRLVLVDGLAMSLQSMAVPKDPDCPLCGPRAVEHDSIAQDDAA